MFFQPEIKYAPLCIGARNGQLFCLSVTEFFFFKHSVIFSITLLKYTNVFEFELRIACLHKIA
jgi:hypothetical protein